ncbi:hypothetical protein C2845_PM01G46000 [Panicum miliaceum]|uniref:Uncharacterized protein n=1 Tax=Panicum miliaceum TaxID=4540 RepID=A0A3L6TQS9_PANMI|nr:hypothetical protein C2845_PM01G46000 [Panicum miliaceum]
MGECPLLIVEVRAIGYRAPTHRVRHPNDRWLPSAPLRPPPLRRGGRWRPWTRTGLRRSRRAAAGADPAAAAMDPARGLHGEGARRRKRRGGDSSEAMVDDVERPGIRGDGSVGSSAGKQGRGRRGPRLAGGGCRRREAGRRRGPSLCYAGAPTKKLGEEGESPLCPVAAGRGGGQPSRAGDGAEGAGEPRMGGRRRGTALGRPREGRLGCGNILALGRPHTGRTRSDTRVGTGRPCRGDY